MTLDRLKVRRALESSKTMGAVLYTVLTAQYGEEWLDWDPATIYLELRDDFNAEPASEVMDRISALLVAVCTGEFFVRYEAFSGITHALNTGQPSFTMFDPVETEEAGWAVTELSLIRDLLPFGYSVKQYLKQALLADGYNADNPPPVLEHIFDAKDPSSNVIKELVGNTAEHDQQYAEFDGYIANQLKDMAFQFHELGLESELTRLLNEKDLADVLTA